MLTRAIVRDIYSGARAGRELSLIGSVMALAPVLAPIAGGVLQTGFGWRAVFLTLVVAGLVGVDRRLVAAAGNIEHARGRAGFARVDDCAPIASLRAIRPISPISASPPRAMPACLPGFQVGVFVLQNLYGLTPFDFGVAFALGSLGYMTGSALAARLVVRLGLDGVLGARRPRCAAGGFGMVAAVALGLTSSLSLVLPIAVYLAGLGMVLPQAIAGAMTPFPERAGAASSLFGFVQQRRAALCGAVVGWFLGAERLAARRRRCRDGMRDAGACGCRRSAFAAPRRSTSSAAAEQIIEQPAVEAALPVVDALLAATGWIGRRRRRAVELSAAEQSGEQIAARRCPAGLRPARPDARRA